MADGNGNPGASPDESRPSDVLASANAGGKNRSSGTKGNHGNTKLSFIHLLIEASLPLGKHTQSLSSFQYLHGLTKSLSIQSASPYREGPKPANKSRAPRAKEFLLGHKEYAAGNAGAKQRRIDKAKMIGHHDERSISGHILPAFYLPASE